MMCSEVGALSRLAFIAVYCFLLPFSSDASDGGSHDDSRHDKKDTNVFLEDENYLFAYFDTPLGNGVGAIGPSQWRDLKIPANQCGGHGQEDGFGQSPIVIPRETIANDFCHGDTSGYNMTEVGTCTWGNIEYKLRKDGLAVSPKYEEHDGKKDPVCHFGKLSIPQSEHDDDIFEAVELRFKLGAEHAIEGYAQSFEMQVLHRGTNPENKKQAGYAQFFATPPLDQGFSTEGVDDDIGADAFIEAFLIGWRKQVWEVEYECSNRPQWDPNKRPEVFNVNSVIKAKQQHIICQEPGQIQNYNPQYVMPRESSIDPNPNALIPSLYNLSKGTIAYKGSLTTPPCTENVYWNIDLQPRTISMNQAANLTTIIDCYVEITNCTLASAASEFGFTSRPPQAINNRTILHYCPVVSNSTIPIVSPTLIISEKYKEKSEMFSHWALIFLLAGLVAGLVLHYILSRLFHALPYTAALFIVGTVTGALVKRYDFGTFNESADMWSRIDGELLLLTFLPGLLFKDAYNLDFHLFIKSFGQIMIMAFPMVLAGTALMALVAKIILPYGWSFNLCMTFGSILSATDPVAVSALLNEVGAPPRLKMHICGESLFNDGSAIVFYTIFKALYLYENGIYGGKDVTLVSGVITFVRMSFGGAGVGLAFGGVQSVFLYLLNRRFDDEECVVQVMATFVTAYLTFYVAEPILHTSGVIAVVVCGITTRACASMQIRDQGMMKKFWLLVEHILNTVLFILGGVLWGGVISNADPPHQLVEHFGLQEWGYLVIIFILMSTIRLVLFFAFYPAISRIGTKSNLREMLFQSFGGLRGAVGIALALALDSEVANDTVLIDPKREPTHLLFGFTGGIALLTLLINGVLAGPVLKSLGLNRSTRERSKLVDSYGIHIRRAMLENIITLLGKEHYSNVDIRSIQKRVPFLKKLTYHDLKFAVRTVKENTPLHQYSQPHLSLFEPILSKDEYQKLEAISEVKLLERFRSAAARIAMQSVSSSFSLTSNLYVNENSKEFSKQLKELRLVFVDLLKNTQLKHFSNGQIDARRVMVRFALDRGIVSVENEASRNLPLDDWKACLDATRRFSIFKVDETNLHLVTGFIGAHEEAQISFRRDFCDSRAILNPAEKQVLKESDTQIQSARSIFDRVPPDTMRDVMSLQLASALLNNAAALIGDYVQQGLLKKAEGERYLEDFQDLLDDLEDTSPIIRKSLNEMDNKERKEIAKILDLEASDDEAKIQTKTATSTGEVLDEETIGDEAKIKKEANAEESIIDLSDAGDYLELSAVKDDSMEISVE